VRRRVKRHCAAGIAADEKRKDDCFDWQGAQRKMKTGSDLELVVFLKPRPSARRLPSIARVVVQNHKSKAKSLPRPLARKY
jgi:hypothetical protein